MSYDFINETIKVKKQHAKNAKKVSDKIDRDNNKRHGRNNRGGVGMVASFAIIAFIIIFFTLNVEAGMLDKPAVAEMVADTNYANRSVIDDTTRNGCPIIKKVTPDKKLRAHYLNVIVPSMRDIQSDSLNQEKLLYAIHNIGIQCVFANRLSDKARISPFNMVSLLVDDPDFRYKLICLISGYNYLVQEGTSFTIDGIGHFNYNDRHWYFTPNGTEIKQKIVYNKMVCLVMGVDYIPPEKHNQNIKVQSKPTEQYSPLGLKTVEP